MEIRIQRTAGVGILLLGLCTACGGGGGASQTSPPQPPGPTAIVEPLAPLVTYNGNRQSIAVTQSNAAQLAYRSFTLRGITQVLESLWVDAPQGPFENAQTNDGLHSGTVELSTEIDSSGRGYIEAVFRDFSDDPGVSFDGRYIQRFRPETGAAIGIDFSFAGPGNIEFDNLTIMQGNLSMSFHGVIRITGINSNLFFANLIVSDGPGGDTLFFENCELRFSTVDVGGIDRPALEISGAVYDAQEGRIDFSPLGAIPDLGYLDVAGYLVGGAGGGIELISSGPLTQIRPISFAFASIVMDLDGNGSPEAARRYSWPELSGETTVESSIMPGPIANAGNQRTPQPGSPVKLHGLFSHDDDGDWLTFEWRIIAKPGQSSISVDAVTSEPIFDFTPDMAGDYVFGLRASDGTSASETSVVIRHAPSGTPDADDEPSGGLEVGQPIATSIPITIDGISSINWPYSQMPPFWHRTGFGPYSFAATGNPTSTYFTVDREGLNEIRLGHNSEYEGALNSHAEINLAVGVTIFETRIELAGDANAYDVHKIDYDGDGDQDLALRVGQNGNERIVILVSTPDGLTPGPDLPAGSGEITPGDIDGDGLLDFLSAADNGLLVFLQQPDHSLANPVLIEYPASGCTAVGGPTDIAVAEVDGAGRIDIIAVHPCDDAVVIWLQNSDGNFGAPTLTTFENHRVKSAGFGDIDGDGRADVIASLSAETTAFPHGVSILIAQSDGAILQRGFTENTGLTRPGVTVGDINGDDRNDVIVVGGAEVSVSLQSTDGSLVTSVVYSDTVGPSFQSAVSLVDMDGDNNMDLFFCDSGPSMRLLLQQQNGEFTHVSGPRCFNFGLDQPEIATSLDVNNDGHIDLLTVTEDARGATDERVLLNVFLKNIHSYPTAVIE